MGARRSHPHPYAPARKSLKSNGIILSQTLRHIKASSLKRALVPIRHLFNVAKNEWGLPIKENPLCQLSIKDSDQRRERRITEEELCILSESATKGRNKYILPIVHFALATGMRRGEILAARWNDLDWQSRTLKIPDTKNGYARTIPLARTALSILQEATRDPNSNNIFPVSPNAFQLAWQRLLKWSGLEDLHFHDLRHEAISRYFEMGLSVPEVALISGHRDFRMLFRYTHPLRERVLEKFDSADHSTATTTTGPSA